MNEQDLQAEVVNLCRTFGVFWYHANSSRHCVRGWPDLALCGPGGFMLRELKLAHGELSKEQVEWGTLLRKAGVNWEVWRPADLRSGRIEHELMEIGEAPSSAVNHRLTACVICGSKLDPVLPRSGYRTHPTCDPSERPLQLVGAHG